MADLNKEANAGNSPAARQAADKVKQAADSLVKNTQARADDALERLIRDAKTVRNDATRGDDNSLRASVPELQHASQDAVLLAKQAASALVDDEDADRKNKMIHLADLIPDAVKEEATAAAALVQQPNNPVGKKRLDEAAKKVEDLANELRDTMKSRNPTPPGSDSLVRGPADAAKKATRDLAESALHNPKDLGARSHALKDAITNLKDKAQQAAVDTTDAKKQREIQDSLRAVDELFPQLVQVAATASRAPNDASAKAELEKAKKEMEEKIEAVAQAASPPSLNDNLTKLAKLAEELSGDKRRGDNKAVEDKLRKMGQLEKAIKDQGFVLLFRSFVFIPHSLLRFF